MQGCGAYPFLLSDAYSHFVLAPSANPYAYRWIPVATPIRDSRAGIGFISYVDSPRSIARQVGAAIHPGNNPEDERVRIEPGVHHVSISPLELAVPASEVNDSLPTRVKSEGNTASMLKGRITLALTNSRQRVFDFDIGAGVEFNVWAQSVQKIEVLIPDPEFPPVVDGLIPEDMQLATVLTTAVFRCQLPVARMPLTYSIALTLVAEPAIVPVVAAARDVAIYTDESDVEAGGVIVEFLYVFGGIPEVVYGPIAEPVAVLGTLVLPADATHIPATLIPGQTNAFRITRTLGSDETVVNVVQVLNV